MTRTADLVEQLRRSYRREQVEDERRHEELLRGLVAPLCEAGLVDDVAPDGPTVPSAPWRCEACSYEADPAEPPPSCPGCGGNTWR